MGKSILFTLSIIFYSISAFAQSPCIESTSFKIVVLGSSTAAGSGVSNSDSSWVNRYTRYLQEIHSNNEVVNLAVGGYNTYRIMPTGFVPPASRPSPDTGANITEALALGADAIIVNMPSNDVSAGYTTEEQLFNLDTIVQIATNNFTPIWICTTQPRNFSNPAKNQQQWDIKDSIYAHFNPRVIDFWTTIALPNYTIDPLYDSGDGIHLNDAGHSILNNRVIEAYILDSIFTSSTTVDYNIVSSRLLSDSLCGQQHSYFETVIVNIGETDTSNYNLNQELYHDSQGLISDSSYVLSGLNSCETDTLYFISNTAFEGGFEMCANSFSVHDTLNSNDSLCIQFSRLGKPFVQPLNDTLCHPGIANLTVNTDLNDTVFWYDSPVVGSPIGYGNSFSPGYVNTNEVWYAEAIRGDLYYSDDLTSALNSNVNYNGTMFNLVANQEAIIDSFGLKVNTLGSQTVEVFYKNGSYGGSELIENDWTLLTTVDVNVLSSSELTSIVLPGLNLPANDTIGIHLRMANSSSNLSYLNNGSTQIFQDTVLSIVAGSGIAYGFSNSFYPRIWNGSVHYHFGERLNGECKTNRVPVNVFVNDFDFNIGPDTIIDIAESITLNAPGGMFDYSWSTGYTTSNAVINGIDLGTGIHFVSVQFNDSLDCIRTDSIIIAVADLVGLKEASEIELKIYPNPAENFLNIEADFNRANITTKIYDYRGVLLGEMLLDNFKSSINISSLPTGKYILIFEADDEIWTKSFTKI